MQLTQQREGGPCVGFFTLNVSMVAVLLIPGIRLVFIQFWLFVMSVIAMLYDSVPHM